MTTSINGVSLKKDKIVYVKGIDILTADVYLNNKKLGKWQEDADGGEDYFDFDEAVLKDVIEKFKNSLPDGYILKKICGANTFLTAIHNINEIRKLAVKHWKENPNDIIIVVDNGFTNTIIKWNGLNEKDLLKKIDETRIKMLSDCCYDNLVSIVREYRNEQDFVFEF